MNNLTTSHHCSRGACLISSGIEQICALPGKLSCWFDRNAHGLAPIFLRLLLAYEFGEAGLEKLKGQNWFADVSFPFPFNLLTADFNWTLAAGLEIIAPIALILGFMTRFFSAALMVLTIVAIAAVHWPAEWHSLAELWKGYAITDQGYGNFKLPLMYLLMLAALMFSGAGRLSIDAWWRHRLC
ncbi:HvfX family Cu-binding RiPP maturation protein [Methylobacter sp. YRD-M1]|uniref:HvfX family Cu-binding RiPP maturation protein n=1 Tax=Methylobacter sp. YRD-M1 TaxID=2911520 RepID=UPI00227AD0B2|nr:DoxX family protein [Methylobacter sp. YRD-M1]WAK01030.1 DoxX family protein [Methylobacter sp. YRD-M1]